LANGWIKGKCCIEPSGKRFLFTWKIFRLGYEKESDITWEPIESFKLCPWVVSDFEAQQKIVKSIEEALVNELELVSRHAIKKRIMKRKRKNKPSCSSKNKA
jgi:hypothetical protein